MKSLLFIVVLGLLAVGYVPWVPEVFLACGGNFRCWPKADTFSAVGRSHERRSREKKAFRAGHYKDLTETGNRARKVSGTQGMGYATDQKAQLAIRGRKKGDHTKKGSEGYSHGEILMVKCSEMARNSNKTFFFR